MNINLIKATNKIELMIDNFWHEKKQHLFHIFFLSSSIYVYVNDPDIW